MGVRHSGFALIVVLIAVAAVFALAMQGALMSRSTMLEVGAIHQRVVAERHARAAVVIALAGLVPEGEPAAAQERAPTGAGTPRPSASGGTSSDDNGVEIPEFLKELIPELRDVEEKAKERVGPGEGVVARALDGRGMTSRAPRRRALSWLNKVGVPAHPVRVVVDGKAFRVRMWDALGLLNVNRAEEGQLVRYFRAKGLDPVRASALADQILDWRDQDRVPRSRGAEDEVYARMGVECRNGEIFALEELLFLPAMDRQLFDRIADDLAVGGEGLIHVGTAPRAVLVSVPGLTEEAVEGLLRMRDEGSLSEESLERALPAANRDAIMGMLRWNLSGVLRVRVDALEGEDDRVTARFDGAALISEVGVQEVGLRPM